MEISMERRMWNFCNGCIHVNLRIFNFIIPFWIPYSYEKKKSFWNSKIWLLLPTLHSAWLKSDIFHPPYRTRGKIRGAGNEIFIGKPTASFLSLQHFKKQKLGIIPTWISNYGKPWGLPDFHIQAPLKNICYFFLGSYLIGFTVDNI